MYRTVMVMILSEATGDLRLTDSMRRFFSEYRDFRSLERMSEKDIPWILGCFGIGRYNKGNGTRLRSLLQLRPWAKSFQMEDVARLGAGFGSKFRKVILAYVFGNRNVFPLDTPAFNSLQELGFYKNLKASQIDYIRVDVERRLASTTEMPLVDFHELLRFRKQAGRIGTRPLALRQKEVILGWNGWRVLCSTSKNLITADWIERRLIKDPNLAAELALRFSGRN